MSLDRLHAPLNSTASRGTSSLVEARFIPRQYEPNYAYPLLVLLHGRGGDEEQLVRAMPALSWRNYVGLGLRGPELVTKRDRLVGFGWGAEFEQPERRRARPNPDPHAKPRSCGASCTTPSPRASTAWKQACSRPSCRRVACFTSTPNEFSWSAAAKGPPSPTGSA